MLNASCDNETLKLIPDAYGLPGPATFTCSEVNRTAKTCTINFASGNPGFGKNCLDAGGNYYINQTSNNFYSCISNNEGELSTTDVMIVDYPICVGASCTDSDVILALDQTISADAKNGPLYVEIQMMCNLHPFGKSASITHTISTALISFDTPQQ